jgi:hypothetical protein
MMPRVLVINQTVAPYKSGAVTPLGPSLMRPSIYKLNLQRDNNCLRIALDLARFATSWLGLAAGLWGVATPDKNLPTTTV